jgi:hypothetical protein
MYHLGRVWRRKYEGRGEKRCRSVRTDEVRKWDERPRREAEGNVTSDNFFCPCYFTHSLELSSFFEQCPIYIYIYIYIYIHIYI